MIASRRGRLYTLATVSIAAGALYLPVKSYRLQTRQMFTASPHPVAVVEARRRMADVEEVSFQAEGATIRGWYAPSKNGAAVVLAHGAMADREQLLPEASTLHEAGFGVLLFDWPGHGESTGEVHWGRGELAAMRSAITFVDQRPDVHRHAIGGLGFSMGGYVTALGAVDDTRIGALVLCAVPSDLARQTDWEYRSYGWASQVGARFANRRFGPLESAATPREVLPRLAGRPVLIVGGARDEVVPRWMVQELYGASREPHRLLFVADAHHEAFGRRDPSYLAIMREFLINAL